MSAERIRVCGIPVDIYDQHAMLEHMIRLSGDVGRQHHVCYLNAHVHNLARHDEVLREVLHQSAICYADGASIVWAVRRCGAKLHERMTAADFFPEYLARFKACGRRVFFLGGAPGVAERAADSLARQVASFRPVGLHHGYLNHAMTLSVIESINRSRADIVVLGMGTPIQERWIAAHRHRVNAPLVWAVGALLDYSAGVEQRCPEWMGSHGLEWLYRLMQQPRKMASRYLIGNPKFVWKVLRSSQNGQDHAEEFRRPR